MTYAIVEGGIVTNIVWLSSANAGDFPNAVKAGEIPVGIGDTYTDGVFSRDGKRLLSPLEEANQALNILLYGVE